MSAHEDDRQREAAGQQVFHWHFAHGPARLNVEAVLTSVCPHCGKTVAWAEIAKSMWGLCRDCEDDILSIQG